MVDANNIAMIARQHLFWHTPYRTGNLAMSVGDVTSFGTDNAGFIIFNANQRATYGKELNEKETIARYFKQKNGVIKVTKYKNKHYRWIDRWAEAFADELQSLIPNLQRI